MTKQSLNSNHLITKTFNSFEHSVIEICLVIDNWSLTSYPLIFPIGLKYTTGEERPALSTASTTSEIFL